MPVCRRFLSAFLVLLAGAAAGLGQSASAPIAQDPRVATALELARTWLEAQRAYERIPGVSAAIVATRKCSGAAASGRRTRDGRPATADTLYSICSISKLFTSVAVMQQRDGGKLRLDDPVGSTCPGSPEAERRRGRGHDRGPADARLGPAARVRLSLLVGARLPVPDATTRSSRESTQQNALYTPETHFQYSNLGLTLAGEIVAATSGMPYGDYVRREHPRPLGLRSTTPEMPEAEKGKRLATGYSALDREGRRQPVPFFTGAGHRARGGLRLQRWRPRPLRARGSSGCSPAAAPRC